MRQTITLPVAATPGQILQVKHGGNKLYFSYGQTMTIASCTCPSYPWAFHLGKDYRADLTWLMHKLLGHR